MTTVVIIGTGNMGRALGSRIVARGGRVIYGSRTPEAHAALGDVRSRHAAAAAGDIIVLALPYEAALETVATLPIPDGAVVIDLTNPLAADYMSLTVGHTTSAAEQIQARVPAARVVKAFNTVFAGVLADPTGFGAVRPAAFYAGDDAAANGMVRTLIESVGFEAIHAGALTNARYLEPLAELNIQLGYGLGLGTGIAPTFLRRAA
jgi:8-hydroxy-5-deazaflavin:NADPH oxidoreductase